MRLVRSIPIGVYLIALLSLPAPFTSAQAPVTMPPAEELTRASLGNIVDIDGQAINAVRMAADGHVIISGSVDICIAPGKFIELAPQLDVAGFVPVTLAVLEDGRRTQAFGLEKSSTLPILRIEPPVGGVNRKRVQVVVYDNLRTPHLLMQCVIRTRALLSTAAMNLEIKGEQCGLALPDHASLSSTYLYLGKLYLGRVQDKVGKVNLDMRLLPAGNYHYAMVAQDTDGVLLPVLSKDFSVPARYTLSSEAPVTNIVITEHAENAKLAVKVAHTANVAIVKTRVYISGEFIAESAQDHFDMVLPLQNVPSGESTVDVVGVSADGVMYPPESLTIQVKNVPWDQRLRNTDEYNSLSDKLTKVAEFERQAGYWFAMAKNEHDTNYIDSVERSRSTDALGNSLTLTTINSVFVKGKAVEYLANAQAAVTSMAQQRLLAGRLYRKLKMKQMAKKMFREVIREVGEDMPSGIAAKAELSTP